MTWLVLKHSQVADLHVLGDKLEPKARNWHTDSIDMRTCELGVAERARQLRAPLSLGPTAALRQPDCFALSTSLTRVAIQRLRKERQLKSR